MVSSSLLAALALLAAEPAYRSAWVDNSGQLHIVLSSGKEVLPRKADGQVSFGDPVISADHRTVAWLALYPDPTPGYDYPLDPIPSALVIFRSDRVLHTFSTGQIFWDWEFQDGDKRVAYSAGPMHGGAAECVLRDVDSGNIVARWSVRSGGEPPEWAQNLRR